MNDFDTLRSLFQPILKTYNQSRSVLGRPRKNDRPIFDGVMWLNRSGARWQDLPNEYGSRSTAHRRYQEWIDVGLIDRPYENVLALAMERGLLNTREGFIDATFASAKKGESHWS
jgi:transposase